MLSNSLTLKGSKSTRITGKNVIELLKEFIDATRFDNIVYFKNIFLFNYLIKSKMLEKLSTKPCASIL